MPPNVKLVVAKLVSSLRRKGLVGTLKSCAAEIEEIRFDRKFGIRTCETVDDYTEGLSARTHASYDVGYSPTKVSTLKKLFRELRVKYEDFIFLDIGSGKGRALLVASELPFRRIIGVEFSPELHSIAENNIRAYRSTTQKCSSVESHCCEATDYRMPPENTVLFLFNPFEHPAMCRLLTNLRESLKSHPRQVYLVYNNPVCHDLMIQSGFLEVICMTELYAIYKSIKLARSVVVSELTAATPPDNGDTSSSRHGDGGCNSVRSHVGSLDME